MSDRNGTAYALTVFTAILPGHQADVKHVIESVPRGADSPLARLTQLHTSRLQIFDRLVYQGEPQVRETLKNAYLVFTAVFDGDDPGPFLDAMIDLLPTEADSWWRHCVAYPGLADRAAFKRWIKHNQITTSMFAVASPNRTAPEVLRSLALRERLLEFAVEAQALGASDLQQRFRLAFSDLAR